MSDSAKRVAERKDNPTTIGEDNLPQITEGSERREIRLHINQERYERLALGDLIIIEDLQNGLMRFRDLAELISRFMIGDSGYMPADEAIKAAHAIPLVDLEDVGNQLGQAIQDYNARNVTPKGGSGT